MIASVLYAGGLGTYAWAVRGNMLAMDPDEFATFLSGVFAPLAFLWLVLGFRQQGDELQNSARALWLQGEELRNSVEQQRQLVEVSRDQLAADYTRRMEEEQEADRIAQPVLHGSIDGNYSGLQRVLTIRIHNGGPTCSAVSVVANGNDAGGSPVLLPANRLDMQVSFMTPGEVAAQDIAVQYTDARGNRREQRFHVPISETGGPNGDRTLGNPVKVQEAKSISPAAPSTPE